MVFLAAIDPADLYGSVLRWPPASPQENEDSPEGGLRIFTRSAGTSVIPRNGELVAYLRRGNSNVQVFLPGDEPERSTTGRDLGHFLAAVAQEEIEHGEGRRGGLLISSINGQPAGLDCMARFLQDAGFHVAPAGFNLRRALLPVTAANGVSKN